MFRATVYETSRLEMFVMALRLLAFHPRICPDPGV
jgi:hypothetical protein